MAKASEGAFKNHVVKMGRLGRLIAELAPRQSESLAKALEKSLADGRMAGSGARPGKLAKDARCVEALIHAIRNDEASPEET